MTPGREPARGPARCRVAHRRLRGARSPTPRPSRPGAGRCRARPRTRRHRGRQRGGEGSGRGARDRRPERASECGRCRQGGNTVRAGHEEVGLTGLEAGQLGVVIRRLGVVLIHLPELSGRGPHPYLGIGSGGGQTSEGVGPLRRVAREPGQDGAGLGQGDQLEVHRRDRPVGGPGRVPFEGEEQGRGGDQSRPSKEVAPRHVAAGHVGQFGADVVYPSVGRGAGH